MISYIIICHDIILAPTSASGFAPPGVCGLRLTAFGPAAPEGFGLQPSYADLAMISSTIVSEKPLICLNISCQRNEIQVILKSKVFLLKL